MADINECEDHNGDCGHNCIDTTGSYYCTCDDGYKLDDDDLTCHGKTIRYIYLYST